MAHWTLKSNCLLNIGRVKCKVNTQTGSSFPFQQIHSQFLIRNHSFSTLTKFSEKLLFLNPMGTRTCAYQKVRNVSFSEFLFANVPNE